MKFFSFLVLGLIVACAKVPPGHVGVRVNQAGFSKGVEPDPLGVGWYYTGLTSTIYKFPVFIQTHIWTKTSTEGTKEDDSFTFQTKEGLEVNTDVGINYQIDTKSAVKLFQNYQQGVDELNQKVLRNMVRDALSKVASTMTVDEVYGPKKTQLFNEAKTIVDAEISGAGLNVIKLFIVGAMRLPENVQKALNAKIGATQLALQIENEVAQAKATSEKLIAEARGIAESNRLKANSLSPALLQWETLQKWDGKLPQVQGSGTPLINLK